MFFRGSPRIWNKLTRRLVTRKVCYVGRLLTLCATPSDILIVSTQFRWFRNIVSHMKLAADVDPYSELRRSPNIIDHIELTPNIVNHIAISPNTLHHIEMAPDIVNRIETAP